MGDAADDQFDAEFRAQEIEDAMLAAGCKRCPRMALHDGDEGECPVCLNMNWLDENGEPCEP